MMILTAIHEFLPVLMKDQGYALYDYPRSYVPPFPWGQLIAGIAVIITLIPIPPKHKAPEPDEDIDEHENELRGE